MSPLRAGKNCSGRPKCAVVLGWRETAPCRTGSRLRVLWSYLGLSIGCAHGLNLSLCQRTHRRIQEDARVELVKAKERCELPTESAALTLNHDRAKVEIR
jgi:hypothetical protein